MMGREIKRIKAETALRASDLLARRQVEALRQALEAPAQEAALQKLLAHVVGALCGHLGAQSVCLRLREESGQASVLHLAPEQGGLCVRTEAAAPGAKRLPPWPDDPLAQDIVCRRQPVLCEAIASDPLLAPYRDLLLSQGIRSVLAVPLLVGDEVIGFVGIGRRHRIRDKIRRVQQAQALAHQVTLAMQLAQLTERSRQAAVLEERNRMARDIHDTLAQGFTGILAQLAAAEDALQQGLAKETKTHLRRAGEVARQSLVEARGSVLALRPQALAEASLPEALDRVIKQITPGTGVEAALRLEGRPRPLSPDREEQLLRIGQEALTNTLRHARARRFEARLIYRPTEVLLELKDDGRGFDPETGRRGLGLQGIKERVRQMGGRLSIHSTSSAGTGILVALPARPEIHAAAA